MTPSENYAENFSGFPNKEYTRVCGQQLIAACDQIAVKSWKLQFLVDIVSSIPVRIYPHRFTPGLEN